MSPIVMRPIGVVRSTRAAPTDDGWDAEAARIELDTARFGPDALLGLDAFSHAEVVFLFDRVDEAGVATGARHPRGNAAWPRVGIFAQRGKDRPNRIGLTICRVLRIEGRRTLKINEETQTLVFSGLVRIRDIRSDNTVPS
ncbi:MAG: TrmO family methyltransferase, partial [Elioraea tepidiphila]